MGQEGIPTSLVIIIAAAMVVAAVVAGLVINAVLLMSVP